MQNRAIRNVLGLPYLTPRVELFRDPGLRVLPVRGLYEFSLGVFVFKAVNRHVMTQLSFVASDHPYGSRHRHDIKKPWCRLEVSKRPMLGPLSSMAFPLTAGQNWEWGSSGGNVSLTAVRTFQGILCIDCAVVCSFR